MSLALLADALREKRETEMSHTVEVCAVSNVGLTGPLGGRPRGHPLTHPDCTRLSPNANHRETIPLQERFIIEQFEAYRVAFCT